MISLHCSNCKVDIDIKGDVTKGTSINCPICGKLLVDGFSYENEIYNPTTEINITTWIYKLPQKMQEQIKRELEIALNGDTEEIEIAMNCMLCDLEDTIDIKKYISNNHHE